MDQLITVDKVAEYLKNLPSVEPQLDFLKIQDWPLQGFQHAKPNKVEFFNVHSQNHCPDDDE